MDILYVLNEYTKYKILFNSSRIIHKFPRDYMIFQRCETNIRIKIRNLSQ